MNTSIGAMAALAAATTKMQAAGCPLLGAMVSYNVNPRHVERAVFRDVLSRAGYGPIAKACIASLTPQQALGAARGQIKPPGSLAVLRVAQPADNCPVEFAVWQGNPESTSKGGEAPLMGARVRINASGVAEFLPPEGAVWPIAEKGSGEEYTTEELAVQACMGHARQLALRANRLVRYVETSDVTTALQSILGEKMYAAKFAEHGRGHFILAKFTGPWNVLMDLLVPYGVTPVILPVYADGLGNTAAATAAKEDFAEKILTLRKKLQETANKGGVRGARSDSLDRAVRECIELVNMAGMYQDVLGGMKDAIAQDVEKVKALFVRLQGGSRVTYGAADVDGPLMGMAQIHDVEQTDPAPIGPHTEPDGTRVIPSGDAATAGA